MNWLVEPTHPDRCGGLGFLSNIGHAFAPFLLAQGVLLAGNFANQIFYAGAKLPEFKVELIGLVAVMLFAILGPMLVFAPQLAAAKRARSAAIRHAWRRIMRASSIASGCAAAPRPTSRWSAAPTSSRWRTSATASRWSKGMRLVPFTLQTVRATGRGHGRAGGAVDADDDFAGAIARAFAGDHLLTRVASFPCAAATTSCCC